MISYTQSTIAVIAVPIWERFCCDLITISALSECNSLLFVRHGSKTFDRVLVLLSPHFHGAARHCAISFSSELVSNAVSER